MEKLVYSFNEGKAEMKDLLGGKGANLAEMTNIGLPVPPGFTISTKACNIYYEKNQEIWPELYDEIFEKLEELEKKTNKRFGDIKNPLLISVRSGAKFSMPGMMDTILNLGLNDDTVEAIHKITGNERFAYDSYRRFIQMFSDVVMSIDKYKFDNIFESIKEKYYAKYDTDLSGEALREIVDKYKALYKDQIGNPFPQDPKTQLILAVKAVFRSWNNERAKIYRKLNEFLMI